MRSELYIETIGMSKVGSISFLEYYCGYFQTKTTYQNKSAKDCKMSDKSETGSCAEHCC